MNKVSRILCLVLALLAPIFASETTAPQVRLLSERHRTEWNWVEYRITLTNTSKTAIRNPEVLYYAENSNIQYCENNPNNAWCASVLNGMKVADSSLQVAVDWSSLFNPVETNVESYGKITVIKLGFKGTFYPGKTMNVNFRIFRKDWAKWDCSRDISFQKTTEKSEPNYSMVVYDGDHNLLWGYNPFNGKSVADAFLWNDRSGITPVSQYNGDKSAVQKAGRFWMVKNSPLSNKEKELLENIGVNRLTATALKGKIAILFKSTKDVKKRTLDSLVYGFYNSFNADDATKLKVEYEPEDWIAKQNVCDAGGSCHDVVWNKTSINMSTVCWEDVSIGDCRKVVEKCGGKGVRVDLYAIYSKNSKKSIECLASNKNVNRLYVIREEKPTNDIGRTSVNVENIQLNNWNVDFSVDASDKWLAGQKYTGEHIVAGVYDTGIYFDHVGFGEWVNGEFKERRADYSKKIPDLVWTERGKTKEGLHKDYFHATHVAGILGGNGNGSENHKYRGVAPKVKFYSYDMGVDNQIGHVVNHSHSYRNGYSIDVEKKMFNNWGIGSNKMEDEVSPDGVPKTFVVAVGNYANGYSEEGQAPKPCMYGKGFHSIAFDTKNAIVVGNYASQTDIPHSGNSYGPTWDSRIKPDVMAPGSGIEPYFDQESPFIAFFESMKIVRKNKDVVNLNPGNNDKLLIQSDYSECSIAKTVEGACHYTHEVSVEVLQNVADVKASNKNVLLWKHSNPLQKNYMNWMYPAFSESPFAVQKGDKILIKMRLDGKTRKSFSSTISGDVYLGTEPSSENVEKAKKDNLQPGFYYGKYLKKTFKYNIENITDDYFTISVDWDEPLVASYFRLGFDMPGEGGIMSAYPNSKTEGGSTYKEYNGSSMAAPYVSGIVALMNQAYNSVIGSKIDENGVYMDGLRNSTSKAILIHTAHDMVDLEGFPKAVAHDVTTVERRNAGSTENIWKYVTYGKGPDFVTGWGRVDGEAALHMFDDYNYSKKEFQKFREIEVVQGAPKRFALNVERRDHLRLTLAWDDAPGGNEGEKNANVKKLQNDLDMYLISPSGKYYFPWRLDTLSTEHINEDGSFPKVDECVAGLENISEEEAKKPADNGCPVNNSSDESCFDHRNNVEVVDVDYPEVGTWTFVVRAKRIVEANGANGGQIASIASDVPLEDNPGNIGCDSDHPYPPQSRIQCSYYFGSNLENYVTFSPETSLGSGDFIKLYDADWNELGTFTGTQLSGMRMRIDSDRLNVVLDSDNNPTAEGVDYGFSVQKIETIPYSMLFGIGQ